MAAHVRPAPLSHSSLPKLPQKHVTPLGRIVFGALCSPRENPNSGEVEWNLGFVLPVAESESILEAIEQALATKRAADPRFPAASDKLKMPYRMSTKKLEDGSREDDPDNLLFNFKRKAQYRTKTGDTETRTRPALYDSRGMVVTETVSNIPGGSTGKVVFEVYVYDMPGSKGVQLQLHGFQIAELKTNQVELQPIEGGWISEEADPIAAALAAS